MKSKLTTLCYIEKDDQYLMLHRISKKNDVNKDKWIGVGGHFEGDESPEECLLREVKEETGLTLTSWQFRGIVTFCCEGWDTEYMCLYTADGFTGELLDCNEGKLEWVDKAALKKFPTWDGDFLFYDLIERNQPFFSLKFCYRKDGTWYRAVLDGKECELFDLCDEDGTLTGTVRERGMVHRSGEWHRTVHIWVIRKKEKGFEVLLQKRSEKKDSHPGYYDISSAGHMRTGDDFEASAIRELEEELGIKAQKEELRFIGYHQGYIGEIFWGEFFEDREISAMYLYETDLDESNLKLQTDEVEEVRFIDYEECLKQMEEGSLKTCIFPNEFALLKKAMEPGFQAYEVWIRDNL